MLSRRIITVELHLLRAVVQQLSYPLPSNPEGLGDLQILRLQFEVGFLRNSLILIRILGTRCWHTTAWLMVLKIKPGTSGASGIKLFFVWPLCCLLNMNKFDLLPVGLLRLPNADALYEHSLGTGIWSEDCFYLVLRNRIKISLCGSWMSVPWNTLWRNNKHAQSISSVWMNKRYETSNTCRWPRWWSHWSPWLLVEPSVWHGGTVIRIMYE